MLIYTHTLLRVYLYKCVYVFAASDDADDFPAFEKRGKQIARSFLSSSALQFAHYGRILQNLMERQIFFKENSLRDETYNLTYTLLRSIQKVKNLILT